MRPSVKPIVRCLLWPVTRRTIRRQLTWLVIAAGVLATTAAPVNAQTQYNLVGAYAGTTIQTPVPPPTPTLIVDVTAVGFATQLGSFTLVGQQTVNVRTGAYTGSYTFTAENGDTLTATTVGAQHLCVGSGVYSLEEIITITGGTGEFSGATGAGTGLGVFGASVDQLALAFAGNLSTTSTPGPDQRR